MVLARVGLLGALLGAACSPASIQPAKPREVVSPPAVAPAVAISPEELPGLDAEDISPVVMARYGAVGGCHTIQFSGRQSAAGAVTVDWVIQPDGSVRVAEVAESSFDEQQFHDCVLSVAKRMQFPEAPGTTPVQWKFKFTAKRGTAENSRATLR